MASYHDIWKENSDADWDSTIVPNDAQQRDLDKLKARLISPPVLAKPKTDHPYMIYCAASKYAIGMVLLQQQDEVPKKWAMVGLLSKT